MRRYAPNTLAYSFGPGPITPAVKWIIWANVAMFVLTLLVGERAIFPPLGLAPSAVLERGWVWQGVTYMFLHAGAMHILFNMLGVWMFGVELERLWGTRFFVRYYAVTGVGAALTTIVVGLLPFEFAASVYASLTVGASGALYGILLAFAKYYPERPILMMLLFPVPAKYFVIIIGALSFATGGGGVAHAAHFGGLLFGYLYLHKSRGGSVTAEIKYRYLKWKMNRLRRKFDVYSGGRGDWDRHVH
jgi:membrane associated rhomboid family serine protease